jgi:hypothetical protein
MKVTHKILMKMRTYEKCVRHNGSVRAADRFGYTNLDAMWRHEKEPRSDEYAEAQLNTFCRNIDNAQFLCG